MPIKLWYAYQYIVKILKARGASQPKYNFTTFKQAVIEYTDSLPEGEILTKLDKKNSHYVGILDLYNKIESENSGLSEKQVAQQTRYRELYKIIGRILRNNDNFDGYYFEDKRNTKNGLPTYTKVMGEREDE